MLFGHIVKMYIPTFVATIAIVQRRGCATRFKQYLVRRGGNVRPCGNVPP
jgi:hypothetical protein